MSTTASETSTATSPVAASRRTATGTPFTRALGLATIAGMVWLAAFGLLFSPQDVIQGESVRIMYVHVPTVYLAYLAFTVTAVCSAGFLWKRTRSLTWDRFAGAPAEIGVFFMAIALVTGSLWGSISWGTYWVWDARLTTSAFLFITYLGYLAVRRLGGSHEARARRSGILGVLAVLEVPLVHFSVEWWRPLHQTESVKTGKIEDLMLVSLFVGIVTFTLFYVWLLLHRQRVMHMEDAMDDRGLDAALAERQREGAGA
ncbi:MAG: cytochrome c biogenesis protein CcsA [Ilumatobacteraceae bacterium]